MRTRRVEASFLTRSAIARANEQQRPVLEKLISTGFKVMKVLTNDRGTVINLSHPNVSGWLTLDGVFHRPARGKKRVSVNTRTLERVW